MFEHQLCWFLVNEGKVHRINLFHCYDQTFMNMPRFATVVKVVMCTSVIS